MILDRRPNLLLRETEKDKVRELLTGLFESYRDFPEVLTELERTFREDVLGQLDTLQESVDKGLLPHLEALARWARTDILYDPRERLRRRDADYAPSTLLDARYETVPFFGREKELRSFEDWLDADDTFSVWIVAGAGGLGKTRLMLETVTRARAKGWRAGFLKRQAERRDVEAGAEALAGGPQNVLTVIDYAEDRPRLAALLLDRWWRDGGPKRRLVLLARSENVLVDAVERLDSEDEVFRDAAGYLKGARTRRLTGLTLAPPERRDAFTRAQRAFCEKLDAPEAEAYPVDKLGDDYFDRPHFENILFLHIAALSSLEGRPLVRRTDLLDFVLTREWNHLTRLFRREPKLGDGLNGNDVDETLARATLVMAARPETAPDETAPTLDDFLDGADVHESLNLLQLRDLKTLLARAYPWRDGDPRHMDALRPDPLGEALVYKVLNDRPAVLRFALAPERDAASRASAVTVFLRTALAFEPDYPSAWLEDRLRRSDALNFEDVTRLFLDQIPFSSVGFRRVAARLAERQVAIARNNPDAFYPDLAGTLNNLGARLSELGRREEALQATEEAADLYRNLARNNPDVFYPDLAATLNNLGVDYAALGRREDALQATEEAAKLYRDLARKNPDAFYPNLALALNNLGAMLSELGRREDALQATEEAVAIRRKLARNNPDAFYPNLAGTLNNLGARLSALGRREEALQATEEAADLYRDLARNNPDAFYPNLAATLNNLGAMLSELGRREEALQATEEAVAIRRKLARNNPDAFYPELASAYDTLGSVHASGENWPAAAGAFAEGLRILTPYFLRLPDAFAQLIVSLLRDYANACQQGELELDEALIEPLLPFLKPPEEEQG
ncbi:tetratricopeptide repeat protein [Rhodocaloribacter sp.]